MLGEVPFSELLREHRRAAGYSQEDLAERAGLSVSAIGFLEQGLRRAPHHDTVKAVANALGLSDSARRRLEDAAARARGRQARRDSRIPVPLTSFVERKEVHELKALLEEQRLITITGTAGVGKTRLAIEVAKRAEPLYDEAWFVDLLPVRDASLIAAHIAARLNVPLEGEDGLSEVTRRLGSRYTLLAIDNCEHVVAGIAVLVGDLLRRCASLTVLATSRERLALSAELTYRLPSLDVSTATDLFVERAQTNDRAFFASGEAVAIIEEICKELDGIPLAIELAASRVSMLGLEPLRKRLKSGTMQAGNRDVPLRHQTMEAAIAWSYDLLSGLDRLLFQRLSVFFGSFTLEAAENICADEALPVAMIADSLIHVAQKSLINVEPSATSTRYRFLDSIRTFGWDRLSESGQLEKTMLRLMEWFAEKAAPLESTTPLPLFTELRDELDNVAGAINWAQSTGQYPAIISASRLLVGFQRVWAGMRQQMEVSILGFGLLKSLKEGEDPEIVGLLISCMVPFLHADELLELSKRAIPLLTASGHNARAAAIHARCALAECRRGDAAAAEEHVVSGEALLNSSEHRRSRAALTFAALGAYVRFLFKDFVGARAMLDGLEIPPGDSHEIDIGVVLANIEAGEQHVEKAVEILTNLKRKLDHYPTSKFNGVAIYNGLVSYHLSLGNTRAAENELREALGGAVELRHSATAIEFGPHAAFFAATSGRPELAARLLGACERLTSPSSLDDIYTSHDRAAKAIQDHLAPERADVLRRTGAREDLFDLLEEFLDQPVSPTAPTTNRSVGGEPRRTRPRLYHHEN